MDFPIKKVHIIAIGGIGMSAIADILRGYGVVVQGSDMQESANTKRLQDEGIPVFIGHKAENVGDVEAVIMSTAVPQDNPEVVEAKRRGIPVGYRTEILPEILRKKQGICISGSHGKTTTSSLVAHLLTQVDMHPSFIIGGILNSMQGNAKSDTGKYMVIEADESDGTFLKLPTEISVVTNIDAEHIAYHYKTFDALVQAFRQFVHNTAFYGCSVLCYDHPLVREIAEEIVNRKIITYGLSDGAMVQAVHIRPQPDKTVFDVLINLPHKTGIIRDITVSLIGTHNVQNTLAALSVGLFLGISDTVLKQVFASFEGVQRRLTKRGTFNGAVVYDDYAHHPNEIKATLSALRGITDGKLIAVFQPHRYSRLQDAWDEFLTAFSAADTVFVAPIHTAGEALVEGYTQERLVQEIQQNHPNVVGFTDWATLPDLIRSVATAQDIVVGLGAGTVSKEIKALVAHDS